MSAGDGVSTVLCMLAGSEWKRGVPPKRRGLAAMADAADLSKAALNATVDELVTAGVAERVSRGVRLTADFAGWHCWFITAHVEEAGASCRGARQGHAEAYAAYVMRCEAGKVRPVTPVDWMGGETEPTATPAADVPWLPEL